MGKLTLGNLRDAPGDVIARLVELKAALETPQDPGALQALATSFPRALGPLCPEVGLRLAELAEQLVDEDVVVPGDAGRAEPRVALRWARVALARGDEAGADDALLVALTGWSVVEVRAPGRLIERLVRSSDRRLRLLALDALEPLVEALAITPREAARWVGELAADRELVVSVLRLWARPWLVRLEPAEDGERRRTVRAALRSANADAAEAAIALADAAALRDLVIDRAAPGGARARGLASLGAVAEAADLSLAFAAVDEDPVLFDAAAQTFFAHAHRRGSFVHAPELEALLAIYDRTPGFTADELVRIAFVARKELVALLSAMPVDDPLWIRRAAILARSRDGARTLVSLLADVSEPLVAAAVIDAYAASPETPPTNALLRWLDVLPECVLPALRVKAEASAVAAVEAFAVDPLLPTTLRAAALDALWALPTDRDALLARLPPEDLLVLPHTSLRVSSTARLLGRIASQPVLDPMQVLGVLTGTSDDAVRGDVARLFRAVVLDCVRRALAGDFTVKRLVLPELEQKIFAYGRNLLKAGHVVRPWLDPAPETGRDLVLGLVCRWLEEEPDGPVTVALLEMAARHAPDGPYLRTIERRWRASDPEVKRAALEALLAAGEDARGLELSLARLVASDDPRIVVHALEIVRTMRARWAERLVAAALERPEMAVKKEAALALASMGSAASVPAIVGWLGRHDNASFRTSLEGALDALAGKARGAVLVEAFRAAREARAQGLLADALEGRFGLAALMRLARSGERVLVERAAAGTLTIADASRDVVVARLHRAALRAALPEPGTVDRVRREGFSVEAALALAAEAHDARALDAVRPLLADFVAWLSTLDTPPSAVVSLVVAAADRRNPELLPVLLRIAARSPVLDAGLFASFAERVLLDVKLEAPILARLRLDALSLLRRLPSIGLGGLRRWRLLGNLGAVRTRDDLVASLRACGAFPEVARETTALLVEALSIPAAATAEPRAITSLRNEAEGFSRLDPALAARWLDTRLRERPLDVPVVAEHVEARPRRWPAESAAELAALVAQLDEPSNAQAAARKLLPAIEHVWRPLLAAWLASRITLPIAELARRLDAWPEGGDEERRCALACALTDAQLRRFVPAWLAGDPDAAGALLAAVGQHRWLRLAAQYAVVGDLRLVRFVVPVARPEVRALADLLLSRAPTEAARLRVAVLKDPVPTPPVDPIANADATALVQLVARRDVDVDLAVRAVHALARMSDGSRALEPLTRDRRPRVRSAALRAFRLIAPREQSHGAALEALAIETRRDVVVALMKSLGHGRHDAAVPALVERLHDRDPHLRRGARAALLAWGREVVPALRHASRWQRPDRRPALARLIAELESGSVRAS